MSQSNANGLRSKSDQNLHNVLTEVLSKVDGNVFLVELERALAEAAQKKKAAAQTSLGGAKLTPLPPRVTAPLPKPPSYTPSLAPISSARRKIVGQLPWGGAQHTFEVHSNHGGPNGVDCGILALRKTTELLASPLGLFAGPVREIREELVQMFLSLSREDQRHMAHQYVDARNDEPLDSLCTQTLQHLRHRMLNWHTLVRYIQWKAPGKVNPVIWKQPPKGDVLRYEGGTTVDPNLPFLHVVHYNALHFEALAPLDGDAVARAIRGRVDNAVEYITSNHKEEFVPLLVAPHPTKAEFMLLQFGDSSAVYECARDDAAMRSVGQMAPARTGVSHWFDYSRAGPVPQSVVSGLEEFLFIQSFGHMDI
jgi:hypothetical protein